MALLEVDRVSKTFAGLCALDRVSFELDRGQIKSVIGPNGAGKTTLLNVISRVLRSSGGRIVFDGREISNEAPHRVCQRGLARTFQLAQVFPRMTVLQNVMVGCHAWTKGGLLGCGLGLPRDRTEERRTVEFSLDILSQFGLASKATVQAKYLSYGEQRLVQIGRALASRPTLLMLDEPAAGLNRLEKENLAAKLFDIRRGGVTILLVEHDIGLVMGVSDQLVVLDSGRKIAEDVPNAIRSNELVITAYLGKELDRAAGN